MGALQFEGGSVSRQDRWDLEPAPFARWWARHSTAISVGCVLVMMASAVLAVQSLVYGARQSGAGVGLDQCGMVQPAAERAGYREERSGVRRAEERLGLS